MDATDLAASADILTSTDAPVERGQFAGRSNISASFFYFIRSIGHDVGSDLPSVAESSTDEPAGSVASMARTALMALARPASGVNREPYGRAGM